MWWRSKESFLASVVIYILLLSQWHDGAMDSDRVKLILVLFKLHWLCGSVKNVAVFKSRMSYESCHLSNVVYLPDAPQILEKIFRTVFRNSQFRSQVRDAFSIWHPGRAAGAVIAAYSLQCFHLVHTSEKNVAYWIVSFITPLMRGATTPISYLHLCYRFMKSFTEHVPEMIQKILKKGAAFLRIT